MARAFPQVRDEGALPLGGGKTTALGPNAAPVHIDVMDPMSVERAATEIERDFDGRLDVLVK